MKDKQHSHSITNYLLAAYQGKFAFLNILAQLRHPGIERGEIERTKQVVSVVTDWTNRLWKGTVMFPAGVIEATTLETKQAIGFLENLKPELKQLSDALKVILSQSNFKENREFLCLLVASFGRFAYSRDNFIKGHIEFGKNFKVQEVTDYYTEQSKGCTADLKTANSFFETAKKLPEEPEEGFYDFLRYRCVHLPCVFASYVHDINQLCATYRGGVTFENCDFSKEEAKNWLNLGFECPISGYWRAYEFTAPQALSWLQIGVLDAGMAFEWKLFGFTPQEGYPWIAPGFTPVAARGWVNKNYSPERAIEMAQIGLVDPNKAPELKKQG